MVAKFYTPQEARDITAQYIQEQGNILAKNRELSDEEIMDESWKSIKTSQSIESLSQALAAKWA